VIDLGEQYLTGVFPRHREAVDLTKGPLRLLKCHGNERCCGLLQLGHSYELAELYGSNYGYKSGLNNSMAHHLKNNISNILRTVPLNTDDLVIDIGSNDGTVLHAYPQELKLVGFDPAGEMFRDQYKPNIELVSDFFSDQLVARSFPGRKAKVVTTFSMFYDLESPIDFASQIANILDPRDGIWVLEQSYLPLMLERTSYDTICHEHLEYYGLAQIIWIVEKAGLRIVNVELNDVNGGSFSIVVAHRKSIYQDSNRTVERLLIHEDKADLASIDTYLSFSDRVEDHRSLLIEYFATARDAGKRICGLGASTKGNVLLQYSKLGTDDIETIGDINVEKFGAFTPGTWIPISSEEAVLATDPDYLFVLPWHFKEFFLNQPQYRGRKLLFPLPTIEVLTAG
jgi:hypothetical protein